MSEYKIFAHRIKGLPIREKGEYVEVKAGEKISSYLFAQFILLKDEDTDSWILVLGWTFDGDSDYYRSVYSHRELIEDFLSKQKITTNNYIVKGGGGYISRKNIFLGSSMEYGIADRDIMSVFAKKYRVLLKHPIIIE